MFEITKKKTILKVNLAQNVFCGLPLVQLCTLRKQETFWFL